MPPIHIPFRFEAAILSRMRSPMTSLELRKGQQNVEGQTPHRRRRVELLRDRNKGRASRIEDLDDLGKISQRAGEPVDLVDNDRIDPTRRDVREQPLQRRPVHRRAGKPAVVITCAHANPALVALAGDEGLTSFALRLQRIELLLEPLLGGFTGVDRTADGSIRPVSPCTSPGCFCSQITAIASPPPLTRRPASALSRSS
jgi:hypothetical protein